MWYDMVCSDVQLHVILHSCLIRKLQRCRLIRIFLGCIFPHQEMQTTTLHRGRLFVWCLFINVKILPWLTTDLWSLFQCVALQQEVHDLRVQLTSLQVCLRLGHGKRTQEWWINVNDWVHSNSVLITVIYVTAMKDNCEENWSLISQVLMM